ncbi:IS3 family transposase, partial [Aquirufa beregesia]
MEQLKKCVDKAVYQYNNKRPHNNNGKLSPVSFEESWNNNKFFS